jgi:hypothetical protein
MSWSSSERSTKGPCTQSCRPQRLTRLDCTSGHTSALPQNGGLDL